MRKSFPFIIAFGILFLFLIQMAGTLVESIYILDLMHTSLDEKALGTLFFFSPVLLLLFRKGAPKGWVWAFAALLILARGFTPYLDTSGRLLAAGFGTGSALILFGLLLPAKPKGESSQSTGLAVSAGLALAVCLSVLLRTFHYSIDYSLTPAGGWVGWGLGLLLTWMLTRLDFQAQAAHQKQKRGLTPAILGIFLILTLVYFAFSAPAVIARWTEGSYPLIVILVGLFAAGWAWMAVCQPGVLDKLSRRALVAWNLAFTLSLAATLLAHSVFFPRDPGGTALVGAASGFASIPLVIMLLLFPVLFVDLRVLVNAIRRQSPAPAELAPGLLWGSGALVLLVFINIFTNVWGYIPPVSTPFRGLYWLPFLLCAGGLSLLIAIQAKESGEPAEPESAEPESATPSGPSSLGWTILLGLIFLGSAAASLRAAPAPVAAANPSSLRVMTYNIQAGNDGDAEPAYERQLALIRQVDPDVIALQESDTARISLNNNDLVRYYASSLGYYSYYGPSTVTGTFGTAILSRYPLQNTGVVFSYSDTDEIGTTEAEIELAGRRFNIYVVHPDGSAEAKLAFVESLLRRAKGKANVIALGDYNARKTDPVYQRMAGVYTNAWTSVYPSEISPDGADMSGRSRIDHIFVSPSLGVRAPVYLLPPASETDHPVHWADIFWE